MHDRELLELAAKAAGITLRPMSVEPLPPRTDGGFVGYMTDPRQWARGWFDPLTDDGDALRLAVALSLEVYPATKDDQRACAVDSDHRDCWAWEEVNGDRYAAMRRAIVRAAAALGKQANARLSGKEE